MIHYDYKDKNMRKAFELHAQSLKAYEDEAPRTIGQDYSRYCGNCSEAKTTQASTQRIPSQRLEPHNHTLYIARKTLILIKRHVEGHKGYSKWKDGQHFARLNKILTQWKRDIKQVSKTPTQYDELLSILPQGPDYWRDMSIPDLSTALALALAMVGKLSTKTIRKQRREEFERHHLRREYLFQIQSIGDPIKSVLQNRRTSYLMEDILHENQRITQPGVLLTILRDNFKEWFKAHSSDLQDDGFLQDYETFRVMTTSQHIPLDLANIIWDAMSKSPHPSAKLKAFQQEAIRTPSYAEYRQQVKWASINSAGGMSGLTYSMMNQHLQLSTSQKRKLSKCELEMGKPC